jgi:membrane protein implicated in regulation of membrane protease activity
MLLVGAIVLALFVLPPGLGIAAVTLGIVIEVAEVGFWIRFLRRYRVTTGAEGLVGSSGEVIEECDPRGRIRLRGEIWHAFVSERTCRRQNPLHRPVGPSSLMAQCRRLRGAT